ncbi:MAG: protein kinase [Armatimonadota bacterium]
MTTIVGQVLNERYEILEKIGEGGMAVAYRGRDRLLGRTVAIKIMRPELATDAGFLARFRREARAAAGITHEHIAAVHDTGSDGPYHYIVMEYVAGESLRDRLRREGPLPLQEALRIATEAAEALEAAHSSGVIHRDIKPHNILLGRDGQVKVTDFGIARAASAPGAGDTSAVIGTVSYLSPEQARGETVGPQGDIYSLGATLFEMLTGRPPFNGGDRLAVLHKHVYDRPARPSELRPGLPPEADFLIGHCLEKDLSQRFASARELLSYLAACPRDEDRARHLAGPARGPAAAALQWLSRSVFWLQRRAVWVTIAVLVLAGGIVGTGLYLHERLSSKLVKVPDVVGMSGPAARELLANLGLDYREIGAKADDDVPRGAVLSEDPVAGSSVAPETVVKVVVSAGTSAIAVADVSQMSLAQAQKNLEAQGLAIGQVKEEYSDTVPAGYVARTLPSSGAKVVPGTAIDIVLSLGREPAIPVGAQTPPGGRTDSGREETLNFAVPADPAARGQVEVAIEVEDDHGTTQLYRGRHRPGDRVPPQKIRVISPTTARIYVDGRLRAERQYLP